MSAKRSKPSAAAAKPSAAAAKTRAALCGEFIDKTPTPFHLCAEGIAWLADNGFAALDEADTTWRGKLAPGGKYYYTRNASTLVAFTVGAEFVPGNGFNIVGAHTDSPVLKLKPSSKKSAHGCTRQGSRTADLRPITHSPEPRGRPIAIRHAQTCSSTSRPTAAGSGTRGSTASWRSRAA